MKWGVRRYQDYDGRLTAAGKTKAKNKNVTYSGQKVTTPENERDHSKSDKTPLAIMALNVALDIMTLNPVYAAVDLARLAQAGKGSAMNAIYNLDRKKCEVDSKTGLRMKHKDMSINEDAKRVNPLVHNFDNNTKKNCMLCTSAYDLRRRGYEVTAKRASYGYRDNEVTSWYPKAKVNTVVGINKADGKLSNKQMISSLKNELTSQGDGARGNLMVTWKNLRGGHSVAYEVSNGQVTIVDAQIGKVYKNPDAFLKRCTPAVSYARLDNVDFDPKTIKEVAE